MQIRHLTPKPEICEAVCFDVTDLDAQERMADWCKGRLRGTKLPAQDRIIQIDTLDGGEAEANFGDWILREASGRFRVLPEAELRKLYDGLPEPASDEFSL